MGTQAVVVVHGMGEQLPLDTLTRFVEVALAPDAAGRSTFYSRPESVTGSFESRRFLAPATTMSATSYRPQTEFFEYHWSDKMQGNRLDDLWPTFRRMMLCPPGRVPAGLRVVWLLAWGLVLWLGWAVGWGPLSGVWRDGDGLVENVVAAATSSALVAAVMSYLLSRALPRWLTTSFVDVVRYLDTSPRSYGVRREIRRGLVEMLQALHEPDRRGEQHYDRVVLVAHSLGAYIAYDAISYLWGLTSSRTARGGASELAGLTAVEDLAAQVDAGSVDAATYQEAQAVLFEGLRATGNPWLITDLVSVGTPMSFAKQLMPGKGALGFEQRKHRHELPTCPPLVEATGMTRSRRSRYSWRKWGHQQVLHEGAPFAVVRWTNLYYPTPLGFFGDWFGGELAPLFGRGVRDVEVTGNRPWRLVPALAHSLYFRFPRDSSDGSATAEIRTALDLVRAAKEEEEESADDSRPVRVPAEAPTGRGGHPGPGSG